MNQSIDDLVSELATANYLEGVAEANGDDDLSDRKEAVLAASAALRSAVSDLQLEHRTLVKGIKDFLHTTPYTGGMSEVRDAGSALRKLKDANRTIKMAAQQKNAAESERDRLVADIAAFRRVMGIPVSSD